MRSIAVIPARGGSKRIPRKNIRLFNGKPMIGYAIESAISSGLFSHVLVSTDSPEIREVALAFGANAPFLRPTQLSDDHTGTTPVVKHALHWLLEQDDHFDLVCCIYPTVPLLTAESLRAGHALLLANPALDFAFAVGRYRYPVMRSLRRTDRGGVEMLFPQHAQTRSQDLPGVYHDAGQFYWGRCEAWLQDRPLFSDHSAMVELPPRRVIDIDTEDDWKIAELYFALLNSPEFAE